MINLLSPELKEQIKFAKLNRTVVRYVKLTVVVAVVLGAILVGSFYYLNLESTAAQNNVTAKVQTIDHYKKTILPKATDASNRLNSIAYVQQTQTHFSNLLADLSNVIPQGVVLNTIALTGIATTPVQINVDSLTYDDILALKNALLTSPRVQACDIITITSLNPPASDSNGRPTYNFQGSLVIAFKPDGAK